MIARYERPERAHLVTIRPDEVHDWDYDITCPYTRAWPYERPCGTWQPCAHPTTEQERQRLSDVEVEDCADSPVGWHQLVEHEPHYPTQRCFLRLCESTSDVLHDILLAHGPGVYAVRVAPPEPGDDRYVIRLDAVAALLAEEVAA